MKTILYALNLPEESADGLVRIEWHCPPATPAEIKAAHPKCGTCRHSVHIPNELFKYCKNHNSSNNYRRPVGDNHYCPHHEPKEGQ
jgi:hypothetical protein